MNKRFKVLLIVFAAVLLIHGDRAVSLAFFEQRSGSEDPSVRELAGRLMDGVFGSYTRFTMPVFMDEISEDYMPDKMELINHVGESYYRKTVVQLDYFMNKVMLHSDVLAVTFRWQKMSQVRATGKMVKQEGDAVFVFRNGRDGWKLARIRGNNPLR
jgi:hypothetical protein